MMGPVPAYDWLDPLSWLRYHVLVVADSSAPGTAGSKGKARRESTQGKHAEIHDPSRDPLDLLMLRPSEDPCV